MVYKHSSWNIKYTNYLLVIWQSWSLSMLHPVNQYPKQQLPIIYSLRWLGPSQLTIIGRRSQLTQAHHVWRENACSSLTSNKSTISIVFVYRLLVRCYMRPQWMVAFFALSGAVTFAFRSRYKPTSIYRKKTIFHLGQHLPTHYINIQTHFTLDGESPPSN